MVYRVTGWYEVTQEAARPVARTPAPQRSYMPPKPRKEDDRRNRGYAASVCQVNLVGGASGGSVYVRRAQKRGKPVSCEYLSTSQPRGTLSRLRGNKPRFVSVDNMGISLGSLLPEKA